MIKVFYELSDEELEMLEKITQITGGSYELKGQFIQVEELMNIVKDLLYEYNEKEYEEE